ncbi:hypothetical protein AT574_05100 [Phaeobacter inhibens]|nr:hypothetical protein AT574_05100 [Phaeobacter inhibens]
MFRKLALVGTLPLAIGACMQNAEVTAPPVTVALKNQGSTAPRVQGYKELTFRTHVVLDKEKMKATGGQPGSRQRSGAQTPSDPGLCAMRRGPTVRPDHA